MKKRILLSLALLAVIMLSVSGCVFGGKEFELVSRHRDGNAPASYSLQTAANYDELRRAAYEFISKGAKTGVVRLAGYDGNPEEDIENVCIEIANDTAIGRYGLSYLSGVANKIVSFYEVKFTAAYKIPVEEMKSINFIYETADLGKVIEKAMDDMSDSVTVYFVPEISEYADMEYYIHSEFYKEPQKTVFRPRVTVSDVFPTDGSEESEGTGKIIKAELSYPAENMKIAEMRAELGKVVDRVSENMVADDTAENILALARTVTDSLEIVQTSEEAEDETAYGALIGKRATSEGAALAFRILCAKQNIGCITVKGEYAGSVRFWNIVALGGNYYHIDLSNCVQQNYGDFFLKSDETLPDGYTYDTEAYPACMGSTDYSYLTAGQTGNQ